MKLNIAAVERGPMAVGLLIALFLLLFLGIPVAKVIFVAFQDPNTGQATIINFVDFFRNSLFRESFVNSFYVSAMSVVLASILAIAPVFLVWLFGQGGGPLFGQGEGGTGAITYIGVSLLIDALRADAGCEVMALPGLIFGNRTHLACIVFSPIDVLENQQEVR